MVALNWVEGGDVDGRTKNEQSARSSGEGGSVEGSQCENWPQGFYHVPLAYNQHFILCV